MEKYLLQEDYTLPLSHSAKKIWDQQETLNKDHKSLTWSSSDHTINPTLSEKNNEYFTNDPFLKVDEYLNLPQEKQTLSGWDPATTSHPSDASYLRTPLRHFTQAVPEALRRNIKKFTVLAPFQTPPEYGEKTIGSFGSFVYLVNQIFGAGILALPYVMKVSGWLPCFFANCFISMVAMFGTLMILRVMTMIQGNQNFDKRVEYIPTVEYFLGRRYRLWTEVCFYISIQSLNVMSIVIVAQSIDYLLLSIFGRTFAFLVQPYPFRLSFKTFFTHEQTNIIYSSSDTFIFGFTLGYILNACICIPLSSQTIDENMKIQYVSFAFLMGSILQVTTSAFLRILETTQPNLVVRFFSPCSFLWNAIQAKEFSFLMYLSQYANGSIQSAIKHFFHAQTTVLDNPPITLDNSLLKTNVQPPKMFGMYQYGQLFSTFIASYSYVNVIPSWANEMTPGVKFFIECHVLVTKTVAYSTFFTCVTYYLFGYILAYSFPLVSSDNIFNEILQRETSLSFLTKSSIYVFNLLTVLPGIVVYSITTRYNLLNSGLATPYQSFFLSCVTPFFFAWLLSNDDYFSLVLQLSSLIFSLVVNFIIPLILYITACGAQRMAKRNPTQAYFSQNQKTSSMSKGNPYPLPDVTSKLIQYLKSLPFEELDADLLPLLENDSSSSSSTSKVNSQKSSTFFLSDTSSQSDATFSQYHDALTLSSLDKTIHSRNKRVYQYCNMIKENSLKKKEKKVLKKNKTLTTLINNEKENKCLSLLEWSENYSSAPFHSHDSLKRHHTWSNESFFTNHENNNVSQSSTVLSLNTSIHRSFSETDTNSFDQVKKYKIKLLQLYRKPFTKSLTIIPLTRKPLYTENTFQTNQKSNNLQKKTTVKYKGNFSNKDQPCHVSSNSFNSSLSNKTVHFNKQALPDNSRQLYCHEANLQQESLPQMHSNILTPSSSIWLNDKQKGFLDSRYHSTRYHSTRYLEKKSNDKNNCRDSLVTCNGSPINQHYKICVSNPDDTFRALRNDSKDEKLQRELSDAELLQTTFSNEPKLIVPIQGAEDAYECDEIPNTDELKPIRIHVFPRGILRTYHLTTTRILLISLVAFCILSVGSQIIVNLLGIR